MMDRVFDVTCGNTKDEKSPTRAALKVAKKSSQASIDGKGSTGSSPKVASKDSKRAPRQASK